MAFHCSARVDRFAVEVARIGVTREVVWQQANLVGTHHPTPDRAYADGCGWPVTFTLPIPADWRSGFYEVTLCGTGVNGPEALSHAFFVVCAPATAKVKILLVLATSTYNAYKKGGGN